MKELFLALFTKARERDLRLSYWEETIPKGREFIYQIKISDNYNKVIYTKDSKDKEEVYQLVLENLLSYGLKGIEENYRLKIMEDENKKLRKELEEAQTIQFKMTKGE